MYSSKLRDTTFHLDKMWRLFGTMYKTNQRRFCKTLIHNFAEQCRSCIQLTAKCHYVSNTTDTSRGNIQVYYGSLTPQIRAVKVFSLLSSVAGLAAQPVLIHEMPNLGTPIVVCLFGFVGFFTFVTPFLLHMITKKYVTHIYLNSGTGNYSAVCLDFFLREKTITFTTDDIVVPDVPGVFTSFQIRGAPLFVDPRLFNDPEHYAKMMGYDRPIDFKLNNVSREKMNSEGKKDKA